VLFLVQYVVVGVFVGLAGRHDIVLPLFLNVLVYAVGAGAYASMITAFTEDKLVPDSQWHIQCVVGFMLLETLTTTTTISSF
jgi:hypothetical protein